MQFTTMNGYEKIVLYIFRQPATQSMVLVEGWILGAGPGAIEIGRLYVEASRLGFEAAADSFISGQQGNNSGRVCLARPAGQSFEL